MQASRACSSTSTSRIPSPFRRSGDRKSTRLNSSHSQISYAVFCLKKKKKHKTLYIDGAPLGRPSHRSNFSIFISPRLLASTHLLPHMPALHREILSTRPSLALAQR